jgi:hypothetical protein
VLFERRHERQQDDGRVDEVALVATGPLFRDGHPSRAVMVAPCEQLSGRVWRQGSGREAS